MVYPVPPLSFPVPPALSASAPQVLPSLFSSSEQRILIGVDSETCLIAPGDITPPLVCVSTCYRDAAGNLVTELFTRDEGVEVYRRLLSDKRYVIIIHNGPFDLAVACNEDPTLVPLVFDALREGRIICTITVQKLIDVALGQRKFRKPIDGYTLRRVVKATDNLAELIDIYYGEHVEKADTWRKSYGLLRGFPLSSWPASARIYAMKDAEYHLRLYEAQLRFIKAKWGVLPDQDPRQRGAWALALMGGWGFRSEREATERFIAHCNAEIEKMQRVLHAHSAEDCVIGGCDHKESGIIKIDNTRCMAEIRRRVEHDLKARGIPVPMTDPSEKFPDGQVKTDEETLHRTNDPKLHLLADSLTFEKHRGQWGPVLLEGTRRPICCKYNILVDNGRTSCGGDRTQDKGKKRGATNIQNPPRKGEVRGCVVPRKGWLICSTDADTVELRANAQNCLELVGFSKMAEAIQNQFYHGGPDLHVVLGAGVAGISAAEAHRLHNDDDVVFANVRQLSKHGNFAFAGGAGAPMFVVMARGFGIKLGETPEEELMKSANLRRVWFDTWPEEVPYFKLIGDMIAAGRRRTKGVQLKGTIKQLMSGRIRGDASFTAGANSFFSGRVADAMVEVLWRLSEECYTGRCTTQHVHGQASSLCTYAGRTIIEGSRPIAFLHDEPLVEHPEDGSETDRAERQRQLMVETLNKWMNRVPCTSTAVLMRRWQKGAKPLTVNGKLLPVKPVKVVVDGKEKVKWVHDLGVEDRGLIIPDSYEVDTSKTMDTELIDAQTIEEVAA